MGGPSYITPFKGSISLSLIYISFELKYFSLQVYFFNITNPKKVFDGLEKPNLVELGPYTYTQQWLKQNITWHDNGTISYKTRKIFT